ncbi:MAG: hypothetical protein JW936_07420 [Sedimentisphaerales bacterium]|nr:hypothetical protein [Sedimentisphaerales bacterium]
MDSKRLAYVLFLALLIGLALVHLRTTHRRRVCQITMLMQEARQVEQQLPRQQAELSAALQSPQQLRRQLENIETDLYPMGMAPTGSDWLADNQ